MWVCSTILIPHLVTPDGGAGSGVPNPLVCVSFAPPRGGLLQIFEKAHLLNGVLSQH